MLARNPNIGRERLDIAAGVRSLISGSYLILYRILTGEVEVVRYVHVRRQLKWAAMKMLIGKMPVAISLERSGG